MKKLLLLFSILFFIFYFPLLSPVLADDCVNNTLATDSSGNKISVSTIGCLETYVQNAIGFIFALIGAVALIFLIFGSIKFITSGGDQKAVEEAKKNMTYAILGLAVILSIYLIFNILGIAMGIDLLNRFKIVYP